MAQRNVYMKELDLIETFGATTIIASDKTGTLTKNVMTVTDLWSVNTLFKWGKREMPSPTKKASALKVSGLESLERHTQVQRHVHIRQARHESDGRE